MTTEPASRLPKLLAVTRKPDMELTQVLLTFEDYVEAWSVFQWVAAASIHRPTSVGSTSLQESNAMETYIGTKLVRMQPMTRGEYNEFRGWTVPADENPEDEGYLVEYLDGGKPNTPHFAGYVSWSPKAQADAAYRPTSGMPFGLAIEAMKKGKRVARAGWNGKGMWIALTQGSVIDVELARSGACKAQADAESVDSITILPHLDMRAADGSIVIGWLASQTDMLADDWAIVE